MNTPRNRNPSPETIRRYLKEAKTLIDSPEKWLKGVLHNDEMTAHCAVGALLVALGNNEHGGLTPCIQALEAQLPPESKDRWGYSNIVLFNNALETTHQDMMDLFDRAIDPQQTR